MTTTEERPDIKTGELLIMDPNAGHNSIYWDRNDPASVAIAKAAWDFAKSAEGGRMLGYRVEGEEGTQGAVMREFDPTAERLILRPQQRGG